MTVADQDQWTEASTAVVVATLKRHGVDAEDLRYLPLVTDDCFDPAEFWERIEKYGSDKPDESLRIRLAYALWVERRLIMEADAGDSGPVKAADYPYL